MRGSCRILSLGTEPDTQAVDSPGLLVRQRQPHSSQEIKCIAQTKLAILWYSYFENAMFSLLLYTND